MAFIEEQEIADAADPSDAVPLESPDDIDLADRMKAGREQIITEVRKLIIAQELLRA